MSSSQPYTPPETQKKPMAVTEAMPSRWRGSPRGAMPISTSEPGPSSSSGAAIGWGILVGSRHVGRLFIEPRQWCVRLK